MLFDILIIVIIAIGAVFGFRSGFALALSRLLGWLGALVLAFFFHKDVEAWLTSHTELFEKLGTRVYILANRFVDMYFSGAVKKLPDALSNAADAAGDLVATETAETITEHAFSVFVFVGIILLIQLCTFIITLIFSKKFHGGFLGFMDGFAGMLLGLFSSVVAIFVVFALLMPLSYSLSANTYYFIQEQLDASIIAQIVYDNNPLLDAAGGFIPTKLNTQ